MNQNESPLVQTAFAFLSHNVIGRISRTFLPCLSAARVADEVSGEFHLSPCGSRSGAGKSGKLSNYSRNLPKSINFQ